MMRRKLALFAFVALTAGIFARGAVAGPHLIPDIEYREVDGKPLLLDICVPDGATSRTPAVFVVHGGGWGSGDRKTMIQPVLDTLTAGGYLWVSIDYRLSPEYRWPACLEDTEAALAWTKQHVAEYGGDPDRMAILGYSAGGQLAFWAAIHDKAPHKLKGLIGLAPATDLLEDLGRRGGPSTAMRDLMNYKEEEPFEQILLKMYNASPINALHGDMPPILLIHGSEDRSVPFQQSLHIQYKIKDNKWGVPCEIYRIEGAPHRQSEWDKYDTGYKAKLLKCLKKML